MFSKDNITDERQPEQSYCQEVIKKTGWTVLIILIISMALFFIIFSSPASAALYGDINQDGQINVQDVVLTMRYALGLQDLNSIQKIAADVNNDNQINVMDVTLIMRKSLDLIDKFPALPSSEFSLVKEDGFSVYDGLTPGHKMVILSLVIKDPENYNVFMEGRKEALLFSGSINNDLIQPYFYGEIMEDYASVEYVTVKIK